MNEIGRCPFCGNTPYVVLTDPHNRAGFFYVYCGSSDGDGCGARGPLRKTIAEAVAAWNRTGDGWTSVKEGLPEPGLIVDIFTDERVSTEGQHLFDVDLWQVWGGYFVAVTHWRFKPPPPSE